MGWLSLPFGSIGHTNMAVEKVIFGFYLQF